MIEVYVNDIKHSLKNKCYFSALALALTLPDMCGMVEFSDKSVSERYVEWYDKYLGIYMAQGNNDLEEANPWLSGEVIYNLRNTFLHQGSPNVISHKIKDVSNQIDKFILVLGDGTKLWNSTVNIDIGNGKATFKAILVDVTYLCNNLCDCALWYYENERQKFGFDFDVVTQEEFMNPPKESEVALGLAKIVNQKLGIQIRIKEDSMPELSNVQFKIVGATKNEKKTKVKEKAEIKKKQSKTNKIVSKEKREAQVRSFFGRYLKKQIYIDKKEEIIQAVLKAKTKQQVNNNLMKYFSNKEVSAIYKILQPLIKNMPGK